jgi:hypothetical protein
LGQKGLEDTHSKFSKLNVIVTNRDLTTEKAGLKYREIPAHLSLSDSLKDGASGFMSSKPFPRPPSTDPKPCKHPRVQIVSREEDAEFVECLECREVFESSELKDMSIEESSEAEDGEV